MIIVGNVVRSVMGMLQLGNLQSPMTESRVDLLASHVRFPIVPLRLCPGGGPPHYEGECCSNFLHVCEEFVTLYVMGLVS